MSFLKNLFSPSKPSIDSVRIDVKGWIEQEKNPEKYLWELEDYPAILTLNFVNRPPDLPTQPANIEQLRVFYRSNVSQHNGGLIEVSSLVVKSVLAIQTIFKFPLQPTGMAYIGSITLPFKDCSYVIKIQAHEEGITGMRDSVIMEKMMQEGIIELGKNGIVGWFKDPYDPETKDGRLMNLSEKEEYDSLFADHPLTFVRTTLKSVLQSIHLHEELLKIERF